MHTACHRRGDSTLGKSGNEHPKRRYARGDFHVCYPAQQGSPQHLHRADAVITPRETDGHPHSALDEQQALLNRQSVRATSGSPTWDDSHRVAISLKWGEKEQKQCSSGGPKNPMREDSKRGMRLNYCTRHVPYNLLAMLRVPAWSASPN